MVEVNGRKAKEEERSLIRHQDPVRLQEEGRLGAGRGDELHSRSENEQGLQKEACG